MTKYQVEILIGYEEVIKIEVQSWITWYKTLTCFSDFYASSKAIIRQLSEKERLQETIFNIIGVVCGTSSQMLHG